jgi:hypothetical protein
MTTQLQSGLRPKPSWQAVIGAHKLHGFEGSLLGVCVNMQQLLTHLGMYRAWQ